MSRLELIWPNKERRLLAHGDDTYELVDPADWRVSEVHPLHYVETVGDADSGNLLIQGDALHALTALTSLPDLAERYLGQVRLVYIDPPFNTGQTFRHYDDAVEHSVWLTMLRDCLVQIRRLLTPDGSVWVHLDDTEVHRARCVLDEVFGAENFVASVIWEKTDSPRMDADGFSVRHDTILVYRRSKLTRIRQLPSTKSHANRVDEEGRRYYLNPLRARGGQGSTRAARPTLYYPLTAPDGTEVYPKLPDGGDGAWRWSRKKYETEKHRVDWIKGRNGWTPNYRIYEAEDATRPPETIWPFSEVGSTRTSAREVKELLDGRAFSTPKPEQLLARIIKLASDPGDIVLDCFAGSATTAAVAHKMGRRWVAVERSKETVEHYIVPRLRKVIEGEDLGGVSTATTVNDEGVRPKGISLEEAKAALKVLRKVTVAHGPAEDPTQTTDGDGFEPMLLDGELRKQLLGLLSRAAKTSKTTEVLFAGGGGFDVAEVGPSMFDAGTPGLDTSGQVV
jgi:adenine-specific DNA-methyltransferase